MPTENFLLQYWQEQSLVFLQNLSIIRQKPGKKAVHDIRVAIKKLKSSLALANTVGPGDEEKKFELIQQFFRISGKHRDVDTCLLLLQRLAKKEQVTVPSLTQHFKKILPITRKAMQSAAVDDHEAELASLSGWMHSSLSSFSDETIARQTEKMAADCLNELNGLADKFREHAHAIRKLLKKLYYWLKQCPVNPFFDKSQMKKLDRVLTDLGNWHDYFVLRIKVKVFRREYLVKGTIAYRQAKKLEELAEIMQDG
ncbi:MAG: CHAD domain-containing protein, partial [Bacteroidota bacterium]